MFAFIDRISIGFAELTMNREMSIIGQHGFAAGIFFFGYFFFELPSNLVLHNIGAGIWITRILITWGTLGLTVASSGKWYAATERRSTIAGAIAFFVYASCISSLTMRNKLKALTVAG